MWKVKSEEIASKALITLRQARVIREMLRLGSFTVSQIAANTNEPEHYVQNLIGDPSAVLKRLDLLIPVEGVKLGATGPGAPPKVWVVNPERQEEIIQRLGPYYDEFNKERQSLLRPEESVYTFLPSEPLEDPSQAYSATISIQRKGDTVQVCTPIIEKIEGEISSMKDGIILDRGKIANGLAALCQTRKGQGNFITAIINFKPQEAQFVFLRRGKPESFFTTRLQTEGMSSWEVAPKLNVSNQYLVLNQLKSAVDLHEMSHAGEKVDEILITGNLRSPGAVCKIIGAALRMHCEFLDPTEYLAFSADSSSIARNRILNCVPEIGYAFRRWSAEQQGEDDPKPNKRTKNLFRSRANRVDQLEVTT